MILTTHKASGDEIITTRNRGGMHDQKFAQERHFYLNYQGPTDGLFGLEEKQLNPDISKKLVFHLSLKTVEASEGMQGSQ